MFWDNQDTDYDYKRLRKDLENEYGAQGAAFSGGFGFMQMMEASTASEDELVEMAKDLGFDLGRYRV